MAVFAYLPPTPPFERSNLQCCLSVRPSPAEYSHVSILGPMAPLSKTLLCESPVGSPSSVLRAHRQTSGTSAWFQVSQHHLHDQCEDHWTLWRPSISAMENGLNPRNVMSFKAALWSTWPNTFFTVAPPPRTKNIPSPTPQLIICFVSHLIGGRVSNRNRCLCLCLLNRRGW